MNSLAPVPSFVLLLGFAFGQCPSASSTFDTNLEGWTRVLENGAPATDPSTLFFAAPGGNPGGYAFFDDGTGGQGSWIEAPAGYHGDWSCLDTVGAISFDHRLISVGLNNCFVDYGVVIDGPGGVAKATAPGPTGPTPWTHLVFPIEQAAWTMISGTWSALLADVTGVRIKIEVVNNCSTLGETCGIDNVRLRSGYESVSPGCGIVSLTPGGYPRLGNTVTFALGAVQGLGFVVAGTVPGQVPICPQCTLGMGPGFVVSFTSVYQLPIPVNPGLVGSNVYVQGVDFLSAGGCQQPLVLTLSETLRMTIQQ